MNNFNFCSCLMRGS